MTTLLHSLVREARGEARADRRRPVRTTDATQSSSSGSTTSSPAGGCRARSRLQHHLRVVEPVAVQVAQLPHPVPHGLRVDVEVGGDVVPPALVQQPGAQRLPEPLCGGRPGLAAARGRGCADRRARRGPHRAPRRPGGPRCPAGERVQGGTRSTTRAARRYDARAASHGRGRPTTACLPARTTQQRRRSRPPCPGPAAARALAVLEAGRTRPHAQRPEPSSDSTPRTCAAGSSTAGGRGSGQSARSALAASTSALAPESRFRASRSR